MSVKLYLTVHGMGNPEEFKTTEWVKALYPDLLWEKKQFTHSMNKVDYLESSNSEEPYYVFEFYYDDITQRYQDQSPDKEWIDALPTSLDFVKSFLKTHIRDVVTTVLVPEAIQYINNSFGLRYLDLIKFIQLNHGTDSVQLNILCHSLGTYIVYEGLHHSCSMNLSSYFKTRCVMCAPMLYPISKVQSTLHRHNFTAQNANKHPYFVGTKLNLNTLLAYNTTDPFYIIQDTATYEDCSADNFYKEYHEFTEAYGFNPGESHGITGSYIPNLKDKIIDLFS